MKPLLLEDWKNWQPTKDHPTVHHAIAATFEVGLDEVKPYEVVIAYESVGSWGCDSSCFFLLHKGGKFYEVHGSHCSCYGFEGQWEPKEAPLEYLQSEKFYVDFNDYDINPSGNAAAIRARIAKLRAPKARAA